VTSSCSHWHSLHFYSFSSLRLVSPPYSQLCVIATDRRLGSCLLSYSTGLFVCLYTGISCVSYWPLYFDYNETHRTATRSRCIVAYFKHMTVVFVSQLCTCFCSDTSVAFWHLKSTRVQRRIFLLFSSDFRVYFSRAFVWVRANKFITDTIKLFTSTHLANWHSNKYI